MLAYLRDPQEIYRLSFETIRREAPVDGLPSDIAGMAVRLIHACGMTDILERSRLQPGHRPGGPGGARRRRAAALRYGDDRGGNHSSPSSRRQ